MRKLWAFGDSHIAGSGLANYSHDEVVDWLLENTGFSNFDEYNKSIDFDMKVAELLLQKWNKFCKNKDYPENSYAGKISSILNYKLVSLAIPGSGIDYSFKEIQKNEHKIKWDKDIVLLNLPPVYRYTSNIGQRMQYALMDKRHYLIAPSLKTMEDMYVAMYFYIKTYYPKIKIIHITDTSVYNDKLQNICLGDNTVYVDNHRSKFANAKTPCGHWIKELHEIFAKELIEDLKL